MKRKIVICMGSSCFARGNEENLRVIEDFLKSNHLEADVLLSGRCCAGICFGFIAWTAVNLICGRRDRVNATLIVFSIFFILKYLFL